MLQVIKIGGNVIDDKDALDSFLSDFSKINTPKILIHGGGKIATQLSQKLEIPTQMIDGRRVTDAETIKVVTMVYAGLINKQITAQLISSGCNAIGLSGADANVIPAKKRPSIPVDYGFVGDVYPQNINTAFVKSLIDQKITPVFCAITHDGNGNLLNSNADTIASSVAIAMSSVMPVALTFCFEKRGVLSDPDNDDSVIDLITRGSYATMLSEKIISGGMIPKIDNAYKAIDAGVSKVIIKHAADLNIESGTVIV